MNPFAPQSDFVSPSLNQAVIVDLPDVGLPDELRGKRGIDLLSAKALRRLIAPHAPDLGLDSGDPQLLSQFAELVGLSPVAQGIVADYGRRLGYLLLMLKRGDQVNRDARSTWNDEHWAWWANIQRVYLGGGLMSGRLGAPVAAMARTVMQAHGFTDFAVRVSPYGGDVVLAGAERLAPSGSLLFDFGHTQVKRAVAGGGSLPSVPPRCEPYTYHGWDVGVETVTAVHTRMLDIISQTWTELAPPSSTIVCSLACYLHNGRPYPSHLKTGCYARLQLLSDDLPQFMTDTVRARLGTPVTVNLVHDATAAGLAHVGEPATAVITLGTTLGIGFAPLKIGK